MKDYILNLVGYVCNEISRSWGRLKNRSLNGYSPGGDAQFDVDERISIAVARFNQSTRLADVEYALLKELKTGAYIYGDNHHDELVSLGCPHLLPNLNHTKDLNQIFWPFEFNRHRTLVENVYK